MSTMEEEMPSSYDVIVVGTGMVESILAAAASRVGKQVLHIDRNKFYGQQWATFPLDELGKWAEACRVQTPLPALKESTVEGLKLLPTNDDKRLVSDLNEEWYSYSRSRADCPAALKPSDEGEETVELDPDQVRQKLAAVSRKFNLDLAPKLLFYKGPMVDLLIKSQVSRYLEFLNVVNILLYVDSTLELVPCSKADVFATKTVSVVDKRKLMKLLGSIQNFDESSQDASTTFAEFLRSQDVPPTIQHYVLYSIAMADEETTCVEGMRRAQQFLKSLGYCGNSPFLWPLYGSSEILQAFCRLSAVYGGLYCLSRDAEAIAVDDNNVCQGVMSEGRLLKAKHVIMSTGLAPENVVGPVKGRSTRRGLLITDSPLYPDGKRGVSLLTCPLFDSPHDPVTAIELPSSAVACPSGLCALHLMSRGGDTGYSALEAVIDQLVKDKARILYRLFFTTTDITASDLSSVPTNLHLCSGPATLSIDFQSSIQDAEAIFKRMFPDEEFLPAPPAEEEHE